MATYKMKIAGLDRELERYSVSDNLDIAAFIMFDDVEITEKSAKMLLEKCPKHDVLVTAEAKGIPLCYEMARQGCRKYIVARKGVKVYMRNPIEVTVNSITTQKEQKLYFGDNDVAFLKDKKVLIVDDVISTGESIDALKRLVMATGAEVVGMAAVLAEGDAKGRKDIIYLDELPLFFK